MFELVVLFQLLIPALVIAKVTFELSNLGITRLRQDGANWTAWSTRMKRYKQAQDKKAYNAVFGNGGQVDHSLAIALITAGLPNSMLFLVTDQEDARELWTLLENRYGQLTTAKRQSMMNTFMAQMRDDETIEHWLITKEACFQPLKLEMSMIIQTVLAELPARFLPIKTIIVNDPGFATMSFETLWQKLVDFEKSLAQ
jgi:hypothetical protein